MHNACLGAPSIVWGSEFLATSVPLGLALWFAQCWCFWLSLDGQTQNGSLQSASVTIGPCHLHEKISGPIPVAVFQGCIPDARNIGPFTHSTCVTLWALLCPNACGVTSGSPPSVSPRWFESEVRHLFDDGLHNRAAVSGHCISVCCPVFLPLHSPLLVAQIPQLTETEWCRRCAIPVQAVSVWSRHSWIFDTTSFLNSQGRSCEICWCRCVSDSLNLFHDLPVSFQHAFSFQPFSVLCSFGQGLSSFHVVM